MREALGRQALKCDGHAARAEAVTDAQVLPPTHVSGTMGKHTQLSGLRRWILIPTKEGFETPFPF